MTPKSPSTRTSPCSDTYKSNREKDITVCNSWAPTDDDDERYAHNIQSRYSRELTEEDGKKVQEILNKIEVIKRGSSEKNKSIPKS